VARATCKTCVWVVDSDKQSVRVFAALDHLNFTGHDQFEGLDDPPAATPEGAGEVHGTTCTIEGCYGQRPDCAYATPTAGGKVDTAPEASRDYYWPGTFGPADTAPESGEGR